MSTRRGIGGPSARRLTGGLDNRKAPYALDPSESPDLLNVHFENSGAERRGGFVPLHKDAMRVGAARNVGVRTASREDAVTRLQTDSLFVPGHMIAGHRSFYDNLDELAIECKVRIDDLTREHITSGESSGDVTDEDIEIRPILSKGPVKKVFDQGEAGYPGIAAADIWDSTCSYGPTDVAENYGLPFCLYVSFDSGAWRFSLAVNTIDGGTGNAVLRTVHSTGIDVRTGAPFHLIGSIQHGALLILRVGQWDEVLKRWSYVAFEQSLSGDFKTFGSQCPIQVFDCPQAFAENAAAPSANPKLPEGLGLSYWSQVRRFQGIVDDIAVRNTALTSTADTSYDTPRRRQIDSSDPTLLNAWTSINESRYQLKESTGRGNHLFMAPMDPICDKLSGRPGTKSDGTWWFNGRTSYALADLERNANWWGSYHSFGLWKEGVLSHILDDDRTLGIAADVRPDAVAEPGEQVIAEIHGIMRLVITPTGRVRGYLRRAGGYTTSVDSTFRIDTGVRLSLTLLYEESSTTLRLYVNGTLDTFVAAAGSIGRNRAGPFTIGVGARADCHGNLTGPETTPSSDENFASVDSRTGFVGHIERVRLLCGSIRDAEYRNERSLENARQNFTALWDVPSVPARNQLSPEDPNDILPAIAAGHVARIASHSAQDQSHWKGYVVDGSGAGAVPFLPQLLHLVDRGHNGFAATGTDPENYRVWFYHHLANFRLDVDDGDFGKTGAHHRRVEATLTQAGAGADSKGDPIYGCHVQDSAARDSLGILKFLQRRCMDQDRISEKLDNAGGSDREEADLTLRARPTGRLAPEDLAPQWAPALTDARLGLNPIEGIVDWQDSRTGEALALAAGSRFVHWMKPQWRQEGPFDVALPASLWFYGDELGTDVAAGDYAQIATTDLSKESIQGLPGAMNRLEIAVWVYPHRLDGDRVIYGRGAPFDSVWNHLIRTRDGALVIEGTLGGTTNWRYDESLDDGLLTGAIKPHTWNYVVVRIGTFQGVENVSAWVNGQRVNLTTPSSHAELDDGAAPSSAAGDINYVGGTPAGGEAFLSRGLLSDVRQNARGWTGFIGEVRVSEPVDEAPPDWIRVPQEPHTATAADAILVPFNEGVGHVALSSLNTTGNGVLHIKGLRQIPGPRLEDSRGHRTQGVVMRDQAYLTNGLSRVLRVKFLHWSNPEGPFRCYYAGIERPGLVPSQELFEVFSAAHSNGVDTLSSNLRMAEGIYQFWLDFRDAEEERSEPLQLGEHEVEGHRIYFNALTNSGGKTELTMIGGSTVPEAFPQTFGPDGWGTVQFDLAAGTSGVQDHNNNDPNGRFYRAQWDGGTKIILEIQFNALGSLAGFDSIQLWPQGLGALRIPRSTQAQTSVRFAYLSASGGGLPLQTGAIIDNESQSIEVRPWDQGDQIPEPGRRLVPPRAKTIAVAQSRLVLGHLTDIEIGRNAIAWSDPEFPSHFPAAFRTGIDSEDGESIIGIRAHYGRVFVFKRSSTWQLNVSAPSLQIVNASIGVGAGSVVFDNTIYGGSQRGIHYFDGSNVARVSDAIERDWRALPVSDEDLLSWFGAYNVLASQFWLSVREATDRDNRTVWVLQTAVPSDQGLRRVWTKWRVPPHRSLANLVNPATQKPRVALGTDYGVVLIYDEDRFADGHDLRQEPFTQGQWLMRGNALGDTGRLTNVDGSGPVGAYDYILSALRGCEVHMRYTDDSSVTHEVVRRIEDNSVEEIQFDEAIPDPGLNEISFCIAGYDAYWSSRWMDGDGPIGESLLVQDIDVEFDVDDAEVQVELAAAFAGTPDQRRSGRPATREMPADAWKQLMALDDGSQLEPLKPRAHQRGRYVRIAARVGPLVFDSDGLSTGIFNHFLLTGFALRATHEGGNRGQPR